MKNTYILFLFFWVLYMNGQPNISYPSSTYNFEVGSSINSISPTNVGTSIMPIGENAIKTIFAGNSAAGYLDGQGNMAQFNRPSVVKLDKLGNLYVADTDNNRIRKISPTGNVTTIANDFLYPSDLALDNIGNIYVADTGNNCIKKISVSGVITIIADGFNVPFGVAVDNVGNIFVADSNNHSIKKITPEGVVTTIAGNGIQGYNDGSGANARFNSPQDVAVDSNGNVYVADTYNHSIRSINNAGDVTTIAGNGVAGNIDGSGIAARFYAPAGIELDKTGNIFVGDQGRIRKINSLQQVVTIKKNGVPLALNAPWGIDIDSDGVLYVSEYYNNIINKISFGGYNISPQLPTGLNFNPVNGEISGTPTISSPQKQYVITATGYIAANSTTISIAVTNVNTSPSAPSGNVIQTFCGSDAPTIASLIVTGTNIQWYTTATGDSPLATITTLVDGITYYASQTVNNIESNTRAAVKVSINDPQITASATTVCSGTAVTITASANTVNSAGANTLPTNLQNGLVGYWPFNGNANDASGNGNNGTVNGATLTTDRFGNSNGAYSFDGIDSYITQNNTPNILTSNYSISIWFNSPVSLCSNNVMLRSGDASNCGWQGFHIGPAGPNNFGLIDLGNNNYAFVPNYNCNNISINEWHNLVYTRQNMYSKQYIDGILVSSNSSSHYDVASNCPIFFGSNHLDQNGNSWNVFNGKLDDIAIYNRALSSSEIQQLYIQEQTTYLWSTGETTSTINPTPTATTTYWCEITANGLTCRKEITITVNPNTAPSAAATQTFCTAATIANLTATGTDVKWHATANDVTALAPSTSLTSGLILHHKPYTAVKALEQQ